MKPRRLGYPTILDANPSRLKNMGRKSKGWLMALGCLFALIVAEQAGGIELYFSNVRSVTGVDVVRLPAGTHNLVTEACLERPAARWLPFVKFGRTVHRRTYPDVAQNGVIFQHVVTTRTSLWVVGWCSTSRYLELTNKPFESARREYRQK